MPEPQASSQLRKSLSGLSTSAAARCSVQGCPRPDTGGAQPVASEVPQQPCNLQKMVVSEPKADPGVRVAEFLVAQQPSLKSNPLRLRSGTDPLHITATSRQQGSRQLNITSAHEAWCGDPAHRKIRVVGPGVDREFPGTTASVGLSRLPLPSDTGAPEGFWSFLNACWQATAGPASYQLVSQTCGLPTGSRSSPLARVLASIEVWPADEFELSMTIPALLEPDSLKLDMKTDSWKNEEELHEKRRNQEADAYYASEATFFREAGVSRSDVRKFLADMDRKKSGEDDQELLDELEIRFKQTDGGREVEAPIDDVIKLVRCIRSAEYTAKKLGDWIKNVQVGPGASFSVECQFFAGSVKAKWKRQEHIDNRVFLAWEGSVKVQLVKLELKIEAGWKCAGLADLTIEFGGEGALSIEGSKACKSPDEKVELEVKPGGSLELTGKIKSQLMWAVSGETALSCEFEAEVEQFHFLRGGKGLAGEIQVKRGAVERTVAYSCRVFGGVADKEELVPPNPSFASFHFG